MHPWSEGTSMTSSSDSNILTRGSFLPGPYSLCGGAGIAVTDRVHLGHRNIPAALHCFSTCSVHIEARPVCDAAMLQGVLAAECLHELVGRWAVPGMLWPEISS